MPCLLGVVVWDGGLYLRPDGRDVLMKRIRESGMGD